MTLSHAVTDVLTHAEAKALATNGSSGINVVPVSMIRVLPDSVWLFDFFMEKTVQNVQEHNAVALTAWTDMAGIQLKADAEYLTEGDVFDEAVQWAKTQNPERVVKGLIVLRPTALFDISPGGTFSESELSL
jgi:predicted pyridoxine 5'-phosphate oxidase superfamily flavin-nucleotide-binding protein